MSTKRIVGFFTCENRYCGYEWVNCETIYGYQNQCPKCKTYSTPDKIIKKSIRFTGLFSCCGKQWTVKSIKRNSMAECVRCQEFCKYFNLLLTPYQGPKRSFGEFGCYNCPETWTSRFSWANTYQNCARCNTEVYPYNMSPDYFKTEWPIIILDTETNFGVPGYVAKFQEIIQFSCVILNLRTEPDFNQGLFSRLIKPSLHPLTKRTSSLSGIDNLENCQRFPRVWKSLMYFLENKVDLDECYLYTNGRFHRDMILANCRYHQNQNAMHFSSIMESLLEESVDIKECHVPIPNSSRETMMQELNIEPRGDGRGLNKAISVAEIVLKIEPSAWVHFTENCGKCEEIEDHCINQD